MLRSVLLFLLMGGSWFASAQPPPLVGRWRDVAHPDKRIEMVALPNGRFEGRALRSVSAGETNVVIFKDLVWNARENVFVGTLISPENGATFAVRLTLPTARTFTFEIKRFFLSRRFRFERIE